MIDKADSGAQATAKFWVVCIGSLSDILRIPSDRMIPSRIFPMLAILGEDTVDSLTLYDKYRAYGLHQTDRVNDTKVKMNSSSGKTYQVVQVLVHIGMYDLLPWLSLSLSLDNE